MPSLWQVEVERDLISGGLGEAEKLSTKNRCLSASVAAGGRVRENTPSCGTMMTFRLRKSAPSASKSLIINCSSGFIWLFSTAAKSAGTKPFWESYGF